MYKGTPVLLCAMEAISSTLDKKMDNLLKIINEKNTTQQMTTPIQTDRNITDLINIKWKQFNKYVSDLKSNFTGLPRAIQLIPIHSDHNRLLVAQNVSAYDHLKALPYSTILFDGLAELCVEIGTDHINTTLLTENAHIFLHKINSIAVEYNDLRTYLSMICMRAGRQDKMTGDDFEIAKRKISTILALNSLMLQCMAQITVLVSIM
jgi:hypothetical protein